MILQAQYPFIHPSIHKIHYSPVQFRFRLLAKQLMDFFLALGMTITIGYAASILETLPVGDGTEEFLSLLCKYFCVVIFYFLVF